MNFIAPRKLDYWIAWYVVDAELQRESMGDPKNAARTIAGM